MWAIARVVHGDSCPALQRGSFEGAKRISFVVTRHTRRHDGRAVLAAARAQQRGEQCQDNYKNPLRCTPGNVREHLRADQGRRLASGGGVGTPFDWRAARLVSAALARRIAVWDRSASPSSSRTTTSSSGKACARCCRREPDLEIVGVADDYDELSPAPRRPSPTCVVTDIRMPPNFQREGIDAAKEIRKRHPGTGIVILSQYDDPDYAVSLLAEGAAGYAYLLKDHIAEGDQLVAVPIARSRPAVDARSQHRQHARAAGDARTATSPATRSCCSWWPRASRSRPSPPPARPRRPPRPTRRQLFLSSPQQASAGGGRRCAAAHAARGDRRPRRAGRDADTPAARRPRREGAHRGPQDRRDRERSRHRADVRHPRLLDASPSTPIRHGWPASSTCTEPR